MARSKETHRSELEHSYMLQMHILQSQHLEAVPWNAKHVQLELCGLG